MSLPKVCMMCVFMVPVLPDEASGFNMVWYMLTATIRQQRRTGPMMAPSRPIQYMPPAIAKPVKYGWPLNKQNTCKNVMWKQLVIYTVHLKVQKEIQMEMYVGLFQVKQWPKSWSSENCLYPLYGNIRQMLKGLSTYSFMKHWTWEKLYTIKQRCQMMQIMQMLLSISSTEYSGIKISNTMTWFSCFSAASPRYWNSLPSAIRSTDSVESSNPNLRLVF